MRSKSMTSSADKMLVWIDKDVHRLLKIDVATIGKGATIGELASIAIRSYYHKITRETETKE
jgi:hypothetical protein